MHRNDMAKEGKEPDFATITNFLRYPGGKRRMLEFLQNHLPVAASIPGRYVEPFLGSGAVFFMLQPTQALLSDINPDLVDLYRGIRYRPKEVWSRYCSFGDSKADYQNARDSAPPRLLVDRAARLLYLNRTCFKGMWRQNSKGEFTVGYGGQARRWVITEADLHSIARVLRSAELRCCDFQEVIDGCQEGDFIFVDPPYRPGHAEQTNDHYVGRPFTFDDHRRLALALQRAQARGVQWVLTTSAHPDMLSLFSDCPMIPIPKGTGPRPGIMVSNSGEVLFTSQPKKESQDNEAIL
jgi:DNA adenine methylase